MDKTHALAMDYNPLGNTGVKVSGLCFGTMSFGGDTDLAGSRAMFHACRDAGINFFDCANIYAGGKSEEILGKLIQDCREEVIITSKVYFPTGDDLNARGGSRRHVLLACEDSLRRLGTDWIDVYFLHRFDELTPLEETLRALDDLVDQGKVLYIGASNFAAWQIAKALGISAREGLARFECIQPMYNLVKRQAEVELLPCALSEGLGVIPYSPLGGGLLTGKYGERKRPKSGRLVQNPMYQTRYHDDWMYSAAEEFAALAKTLGIHPASLAVAWVAAHPAVTAPIIGARNVRQLKAALQSVDVAMAAELRGRISALTPAPPPATDRNEERTVVTMDRR